MAQQTAISWLRKKLEETYDKEGKLPLAYTFSLLNKAEQMEKEQIIDAHIEGQRVFDKHPHTHWTNDQAEQYYNETYGGQGSPDTSPNIQNK